MNLKRFVTRNTVWVVDEDLKRLQRFPRNEDPADHPGWQYAGYWEPYTELTFLRMRGQGVLVEIHGVPGHRVQGQTWIPPHMLDACEFEITEHASP